MVDPGTRQKVGQSEIADVIMEQIETFSRRLGQGLARKPRSRR